MSAVYALAVFVTCGGLCCMWLSGLPWGLAGVAVGLPVAVGALTEIAGC